MSKKESIKLLEEADLRKYGLRRLVKEEDAKKLFKF